MIQNHIIIFVNYERSLLTFFTRITGKRASSEMMVLSMFYLIYSLFVQLKYMMRYFLIILHGWFKQLEYIVSFHISTISCTYLKSCLILVSNQMFCHYIFFIITLYGCLLFLWDRGHISIILILLSTFRK